MIRLILDRPAQPPTLVAFSQPVVIVGRGAADGDAPPDWLLPFPDVSRRQCRFSAGGAELFIEGLSERSLTYVNGQRITGVTRLQAGDVVCFGHCSIRLAGELAPAVEVDPGAVQRAKTVRPAGEAMPAGARGAAGARTAAEVPSPRAPLPVRPLAEPALAKPAESGAASDTSVPEDMSPIVAQAQRWDSHGQPPGLLLSGDALRRGRVWLRGGGELGAVGVLVRRFIEASLRSRRLRWQRLGVGAAATVLAVLGGSATARMLVPDLERAEVTWREPGTKTCLPEARSRAEAIVQRAEQASDSAGRLLLASHALQVAYRGGCRHQVSAERVLRRELAARRSRLLAQVAGPVLAAEVEPDGRHVAVADAEGKVAIWDIQGGAAAVTLEEGSGPVDHLAWSGDRRWLATGGSGAEVIVWDMKMLPQVERRPGLVHRGAITALAFSREGSLLATADQRGSLRLWDMGGDASGASLGEVEGLPGTVTQLVFDASASRLYGRLGERVQVWKIAAPGAERRLGVGERLKADARITTMAVSLKGDHIVTGDIEGQVLSWRLSGQRWQPRTVVTHAGAIVAVQLLAGRDTVVSTAADRSLKLTELRAEMRKDSQPLRAEFDALQEVPQHLIVDPSGRRAFTVGASGAPQLWDLAARRKDQLVRLEEQRSPVTALAAATQSSAVVTGGEDGSLRVWDLLLDGGSAGAYTLTDHRATIDALDFTRQGGTLASVGKDGQVRVWSVDGDGMPASLAVIPVARALQHVAVSQDGRWIAGAAGNLLYLWDVEQREGERHPTELPAHGDDIVQLAFSPDGAWLVSADLAGKVQSWRMITGGIEREPRTASLAGAVTAMAVSAEHVLVGTSSGRVHLWRLGEDPDPEANVKYSLSVTAVAFDVDGQRVASGSADGSVRTSALVRDRFEEGEGHNLNESVQVLTYANRVGLLAVGGSNGNIAVFDPAQRKGPVRRFSGHTGAVSGLAFGGGPESLLTAGHDGALLLWQLGADAWQQGDPTPPRIELTGHSGAITELRVDASGRVAVTAGADRTLRIWPLEVSALQQLSCRVAGRSLTPEEQVGVGSIPASLCRVRGL